MEAHACSQADSTRCLVSAELWAQILPMVAHRGATDISFRPLNIYAPVHPWLHSADGITFLLIARMFILLISSRRHLYPSKQSKLGIKPLTAIVKNKYYSREVTVMTLHYLFFCMLIFPLPCWSSPEQANWNVWEISEQSAMKLYTRSY